MKIYRKISSFEFDKGDCNILFIGKDEIVFYKKQGSKIENVRLLCKLREL